MRHKVAPQPSLDFTSQDGFAFAPLDLGPAKPAECWRGHKIPPSCVCCPICLDIENEKLERALHARVVAAAVEILKKGDPSSRVIVVSVAGYPHISPKDQWEFALCGERINPSRQMGRTLGEIKGNAGMYCRKCRDMAGI